MQEEFKKNLEKVLSEEKMNAYRSRRNNSSDEEVYAHFLWNIQLGEALYPSLQALEIALRNRLCNAITDHYEGEFHEVAHIFLDRKELDKLQKAEEECERQEQTVTQGLIIETLNFGFWTSLFDVRYNLLWHKLIKSVIPYADKYSRTRAEMSKRLNKIRRLRNRIFHHGSIWHWGDLVEQHALILKTLKWLSPELESMITQIDRFSEVYNNGYEAHITQKEEEEERIL